jgi:hypothetical protein
MVYAYVSPWFCSAAPLGLLGTDVRDNSGLRALLKVTTLPLLVALDVMWDVLLLLAIGVLLLLRAALDPFMMM